MDKTSFKLHLDSQTYDKYYQDIEYIDFIGYSKSYKTWENIKDLIDWKGKRVADLGCFHGYFSFKMARAGAIVSGFDVWDGVLEIDRILMETYNLPIDLHKWESSEPVYGEYDVALFLNFLHHSKDQRVTLGNVRAKQAIFEINTTQRLLVEEFYTIEVERPSHRPNRVILLGRNKLYE